MEDITPTEFHNGEEGKCGMHAGTEGEVKCSYVHDTQSARVRRCRVGEVIIGS